jgi:hypothetical protein
VSAWIAAALAGAAAAGVWGLLEPLDQRLLRFPYSDLALLGKLVTRGPSWRAVGWALHLLNGAIAGVVFWALHLWLGGGILVGAVVFAMAEHLVTYPLTTLTDRNHPARGDPELPPLARSGRGFVQATWRHLLFGVVLGALLSLS